MTKLIIIRGLSGSGKSTYAAKHYPNVVNYEADTYFSRNGEYTFNPSELRAAHQWCKDRTYEALQRGKTVVVSNTFTQAWEFEPYCKMAEALNIPIEVIELTTQFENIHGVPADKLEVMRSRWESFDTIKPLSTAFTTHTIVT